MYSWVSRRVPMVHFVRFRPWDAGFLSRVRSRRVLALRLGSTKG